MKLDFAYRALSFVLAISALRGVAVGKDETLAVNSTENKNDRVAVVAPPGPVVNGVSLRGPLVQGSSLRGVSFEGATDAQRMILRGGELIAAHQDGSKLGGENLEGTLLQGQLANENTVSLRIDDVTPTADAEIYEYAVKYWDGSKWSNLCGEHNGLPIPALALAGRWDESSGTETGGDYIDDPEVFTFACRNAVLAKCVVMGYAPWRSATECNGDGCQSIAMRDVHQACTRMMRADYCGDGTPHTKNGTTIQVSDNVAMRTMDERLPVAWTNEAEWTPNGAKSIQQVRWSGTAETYIDAHCSERWAASGSNDVSGKGFETPMAERSLLRNQFTHDTY